MIYDAAVDCKHAGFLQSINEGKIWCRYYVRHCVVTAGGSAGVIGEPVQWLVSTMALMSRLNSSAVTICLYVINSPWWLTFSFINQIGRLKSLDFRLSLENPKE